MTSMTAADYRASAARRREDARRSFASCDTDGFLSQWASGIGADLDDARAALLESGGKSKFLGLYDGNRRVKAKMISNEWGTSWLLHDDEVDLIARRGKKFLPTGFKSRILKGLGLRERWENAPAWADISGSGRGLSGCASAFVRVYRSGDKWGLDAEPLNDDDSDNGDAS